ncbi:FAD-dependent oxidoreductase [Pontibacterium granulatum]|uniref:FAD-dependent oxidoreductase n=1 Tax=Pontibacterium granulatum TaxID=2036029 RepID=UPI00249BA4BC|nr:bifunctional TVP38/TMEM64 family protein/FAD-dependent oxidoreductase [Pontibacterium granulatum]MDI3325507.1 FAD-dependent oxidoreductase [Pontibacterium granulatum]
MKPGKKSILLSLIAVLILIFFLFDLSRFFDFAYIKSQQTSLSTFVENNLWLSTGIYFTVYVVSTGLSLPGAAVLTLLGGALFGTLTGSIVVSFASTFGATLAFWVARYIARGFVSRRFSRLLEPINDGIARDGIFYLLTLRLIPLFPFFAINLVMGVTNMPVRTYYWVSQLGMLPATIIYVNAGTQLAALESTQDILSPALLGSLALLGIFPWIARFAVKVVQRERIYRKFSKPSQFDRNLIVIGAGAGGLVTAYIAAAVKAKVTLIEKNKMGGDCLNTGCVPSKALIRTSRFLSDTRNAEQLGIRKTEVEFDFPQIMQRVHDTIKKIEPHDSVERYEKLGVECISGTAKLTSPWEVEINGQRLTAPNIVLATGGRPKIPDIPGINDVQPLTSDTLWELDELPPRLLILGAGAIACELGQCFNQFGSQVTIALRGEQILSREDSDAAQLVADRLSNEGIDIRYAHKPKEFRKTDHGFEMVASHNGDQVVVGFDRLLVATGRIANLEGLGLEQLGIDTQDRDLLEVDRFLQTRCPNILACGDLVGPHQFTHAAGHQAWYAAVNALFGKVKKFAVDHRYIPFTTYTSPEVARIGLNEKEASAKGIRYEVTRYDLSDLDRAITDATDYGMVKVLTVPGKDSILGVTLVGAHASDMLAEFALAMRHGLGLNKILGTIHAYPTFPEANKFAAGEWKRAHAPEKLLKWVEKYHRWRRGEKQDATSPQPANEVTPDK